MLTLIFSVLIFGLLIGIHEAGHLIAAKKCGVLVHEFSIGMGPKLFSFTKGETVYSLRLIPIGGFCNMEGEDGESDSAKAFCNKHPVKKIIILVSGAFMNILLGFLCLCIMFSFGDVLPTTKVSTISENAPAYTQGLKQGDRILKVNGHRILVKTDVDTQMYFSKSENISLTVERGGKIYELTVSPYTENGRKIIGITFMKEENTFLKLVVFSFKYMLSVCSTVLYTLGMLITGAISFKETSGPVGIVTVIGQAASGAVNMDMLRNLLNITSLITINLGMFNLIPLPALDGGRVVFALIELVTRRKISAKIEGYVHSVGMMALLILMVFVTYNDVLRLF